MNFRKNILHAYSAIKTAKKRLFSLEGECGVHTQCLCSLCRCLWNRTSLPCASGHRLSLSRKWNKTVPSTNYWRRKIFIIQQEYRLHLLAQLKKFEDTKKDLLNILSGRFHSQDVQNGKYVELTFPRMPWVVMCSNYTVTFSEVKSFKWNSCRFQDTLGWGLSRAIQIIFRCRQHRELHISSFKVTMKSESAPWRTKPPPLAQEGTDPMWGLLYGAMNQIYYCSICLSRVISLCMEAKIKFKGINNWQ